MVYTFKNRGGKIRLRGGQCRKAGAVVWQWVPTFKEAVPRPPLVNRGSGLDLEPTGEKPGKSPLCMHVLRIYTLRLLDYMYLQMCRVI